MTNIVVIVILKPQAGPNNALLERQGFVCDEIRRDGIDLFLLLATILESAFQIVRFGEICVNGLGGPYKQVVEFYATPLYLPSAT